MFFFFFDYGFVVNNFDNGVIDVYRELFFFQGLNFFFFEFDLIGVLI